MSVSSPAGTISQANFDTYSNDWLAVVGNDDSTELAECFRLKGSAQNINCVYFSALQIAQLVSTVGAQNIKAKFLIQRAPSTIESHDESYPHFSIALFATDNLNGRLSAYYISRPYWLLSGSVGDVPNPTDTTLGEFTPILMPDALATYWQNNWSPEGEDPEATQSMFDSTYGYLRGYTFQIDDFLKPLMQIPADVLIQNAAPIRINFGLHEYYPSIPNADDSLNTTFGLLVSYAKYSNYSSNTNYSEDPIQDPIDDQGIFYDMGSPCPPNC